MVLEVVVPDALAEVEPAEVVAADEAVVVDTEGLASQIPKANWQPVPQ